MDFFLVWCEIWDVYFLGTYFKASQSFPPAFACGGGVGNLILGLRKMFRILFSVFRCSGLACLFVRSFVVFFRLKVSLKRVVFVGFPAMFLPS